MHNCSVISLISNVVALFKCMNVGTRFSFRADKLISVYWTKLFCTQCTSNNNASETWCFLSLLLRFSIIKFKISMIDDSTIIDFLKLTMYQLYVLHPLKWLTEEITSKSPAETLWRAVSVKLIAYGRIFTSTLLLKLTCSAVLWRSTSTLFFE